MPAPDDAAVAHDVDAVDVLMAGVGAGPGATTVTS